MKLTDYIWKSDERVHSCNCIGPQNGDNYCPCMMRSKAQEKQKWLDDLKQVYDLVPKKVVSDDNQ